MDTEFKRVTKIERDGLIFWRKQYSSQGRRKRMAVLRWIARKLGANALLAPIPLSPSEACATEQSMIRRLQQLGVMVPEIIEAGECHIVVSHLGDKLSKKCRYAKSVDDRIELIKKGFEALSDLHQRGGYLSQAFSRNLTILDGRVGFIDLEEDPLKVMSLESAQARDILFFVHSTARFMADSPERYSELLRGTIEGLPSNIKREMANVVRVLKYLVPIARLLPGRARMAGIAWHQLVKSCG
jgi:tRNA A-37 threonylcarbamoyl transferase component Bud32